MKGHIVKSKKPLPSHTSVGCYPIAYFSERGECLCADCASEEEKAPMGDVLWEGDDFQCDSCGTDIETAYGPVSEVGQ